MLFGLSCKVASKCLGKSFSTLQFLTFFILKILFLYNYIPGWSSSSSGAKHWLDLGVVQSNWGATSKVRTLHYISLCIFSWDTKGTFHLPELTGQSIPAIMEISLLIKTIQPDQTNPTEIVCTKWMHGLSAKTLRKSQFHLLMDWSGQPILTDGKHPEKYCKIICLSFSFLLLIILLYFKGKSVYYYNFKLK